MPVKERFHPGDPVEVPWGLDTVVGKVVYTYGPAGHRSVIVAVPVSGPHGEVLEESEISFPESALAEIK